MGLDEFDETETHVPDKRPINLNAFKLDSEIIYRNRWLFAVGLPHLPNSL